jgi:hypothetical protein
MFNNNSPQGGGPVSVYRNKFVKGITIASTVFVLTGCGTNGLNGVNDGQNNGNNNSTNNSNSNSTVSNLKFSKVSEQKVAEYNSLISKNAVNATNDSAATPSAPMSQGASAPLVAARGEAKASSGIVAAPMSYFPYPGVFEEYVVTDFEEAKTDGFTGTYLQALTKIVKPIVKSLGSDARMITSNGSTDDNGQNKSQEQPVQNDQKPMYYPGYQQYQWQFSFVSSSKKEVYNIYISSGETLVLKQTWGLRDLTPDEIKIDSSDAIKAVITAIKDKNFTSPDNQNIYMSPEAEVLYDIPPNTSWYLYLDKEKGNLVWNINMNINTNVVYYGVPESGVSASGGGTASAADGSVTNTTKPTSEPVPIKAPDFWYSGGYAKIDAATGKVLSLVRPMKYHVVNNPPCCKTDPAPPAPMPEPGVMVDTKK